MSTADVNATPGYALPPGAANVEDDVRAWEAHERRQKWKVVIVESSLPS